MAPLDFGRKIPSGARDPKRDRRRPQSDAPNGGEAFSQLPYPLHHVDICHVDDPAGCTCLVCSLSRFCASCYAFANDTHACGCAHDGPWLR